MDWHALAAVANGYVSGRLANNDRQHQLQQEAAGLLLKQREQARLDMEAQNQRDYQQGMLKNAAGTLAWEQGKPGREAEAAAAQRRQNLIGTLVDLTKTDATPGAPERSGYGPVKLKPAMSAPPINVSQDPREQVGAVLNADPKQKLMQELASRTMTQNTPMRPDIPAVPSVPYETMTPGQLAVAIANARGQADPGTEITSDKQGLNVIGHRTPSASEAASTAATLSTTRRAEALQAPAKMKADAEANIAVAEATLKNAQATVAAATTQAEIDRALMQLKDAEQIFKLHGYDANMRSIDVRERLKLIQKGMTDADFKAKQLAQDQERLRQGAVGLGLESQRVGLQAQGVGIQQRGQTLDERKFSYDVAHPKTDKPAPGPTPQQAAAAIKQSGDAVARIVEKWTTSRASNGEINNQTGKPLASPPSLEEISAAAHQVDALNTVLPPALYQHYMTTLQTAWETVQQMQTAPPAPAQR